MMSAHEKALSPDRWRREAAARERLVASQAALIDQLRAEAGSRDEQLRRLQQDLSDRAAWAFRTLDTLIAARTVAIADNTGTSVGPGHETSRLLAEIADLQQDLDLTRRALENERSQRERLERALNEGYVQLKRRIAETLDQIVPLRATVAVVSKGDEDLIRRNGRRLWHFPQTELQKYAGHHPADSAAAIAHLEHVRSKGAQFILFPATARWWLDHYTQLAEYLAGRYRQIFARDDVGVIFDLRRARAFVPDWKADLDNAIEEFQGRYGRQPAILDCDSGLDLARSLPHGSVFRPPEGLALPYLDSTIDVVVCAAETPRFEEARRVASALLLLPTVASGRPPKSDTPNGRQPSAAVRLRAQWLQESDLASSPSVSIIIPCHNGAHLTRACLAAVEATLPRTFHGEIIVVDDASTDGTRSMLARWVKRNGRGRVLRNATNLGFVGACNRAAKMARGDFIVLLNNDTLPARGWLTALLRTFAEHPDAGAVGGKLVFPDGALQEAGSLVFRDGSAANFGRGDRNPDHPLFNFVRQVDYCSAALLATPRRLFEELGGFDARYRPAYYEDVDYCFRVREKGCRVYYQPAAVVTHREGSSCGVDVTRGVKRHQVLNHKKFVARWKTTLAQHPERPSHENLDTWQQLANRAAHRSSN
jgi:GT2 family glycosyltransferase